METLVDEIEKTKKLIDSSEQKAAQGSFAYALQSASLKSHLHDIEQQKLFLELQRYSEIIDLRMISDSLDTGTIPLGLLAKVSDHMQKMLGHVADRITRGKKATSRIPSEIYRKLNLQLIGLLPGSTRLMISATSDRDLFDEGLAKTSIQRVLDVLETYGEGEKFLESIMDLGAYGVRNLRDLLHILNSVSSAVEIEWEHNGQSLKQWKGSNLQISNIASFLDSMSIKETTEKILSGVIELLSKKERIQLRKESGELVRIFFSNTHLEEVEQLHLNQHVKLLCTISETENPHTDEKIQYFELIEIIEK